MTGLFLHLLGCSLNFAIIENFPKTDLVENQQRQM